MLEVVDRDGDGGRPGVFPDPQDGVAQRGVAIAVGVVAYVALAFAFHPVVIGVPVVGV